MALDVTWCLFWIPAARAFSCGADVSVARHPFDTYIGLALKLNLFFKTICFVRFLFFFFPSQRCLVVTRSAVDTKQTNLIWVISCLKSDCSFSECESLQVRPLDLVMFHAIAVSCLKQSPIVIAMPLCKLEVILFSFSPFSSLPAAKKKQKEKSSLYFWS